MNRLASLTGVAGSLKDHYWSLIKDRQTFLLTLTGIAGYLCQRPVPIDWIRLSSFGGSLFITISGCTVLNMLFDRDIDRKMTRTNRRPLATGQVSVFNAACLAGVLLSLGLLWALTLSRLCFILILGGASLDVLVYTLWLKRRTAWSIFLGGLSGGMPILTGRVLAVGRIDMVGLLLALAILFWIPSHNLTLDMLYPADYLEAGIPTFPYRYGSTATHLMVMLSCLLTAVLMVVLSNRLDLHWLVVAFFSASGLGLVGLAFYSWMRVSKQAVAILFKYSSFYMLAGMLLLSLAGLM